MIRRDPRLHLDRALSDGEWKIRDAAMSASRGQAAPFYAQPSHPNPVEAHYLAAIESFESGSQTRGWEHVERGDARALLRLGRAIRRGGVHAPTDTYYAGGGR